MVIAVTNLQYVIDNYGINNWGLGLEAIASDTGTHPNHCAFKEIEVDIDPVFMFTMIEVIEYEATEVDCINGGDLANCPNKGKIILGEVLNVYPIY